MELSKAKLKAKYGEEEVLTVPAYFVSAIKDGFTPEKHDSKIFSRYDQHGRFIKRYDAEGDNAFQQIIPYVLIANKDETKFFVSKRIDGDHRLKDQLSLGFGGHINPCDAERGRDILLAALIRELHEEVYLEISGQVNYMGSMRDMTSSTSDHIGFVFKVHVEHEDETKILETDKLEGYWMNKDELYEQYFKFEGWSKSLINYLL